MYLPDQLVQAKQLKPEHGVQHQVGLQEEEEEDHVCVYHPKWAE
jgi:hypothetical protein